MPPKAKFIRAKKLTKRELYDKVYVEATLDFVRSWIYELLYLRRVYPRELFTNVPKYGMIVRMVLKETGAEPDTASNVANQIVNYVDASLAWFSRLFAGKFLRALKLSILERTLQDFELPCTSKQGDLSKLEVRESWKLSFAYLRENVDMLSIRPRNLEHFDSEAGRCLELMGRTFECKFSNDQNAMNSGGSDLNVFQIGRKSLQFHSCEKVSSFESKRRKLDAHLRESGIRPSDLSFTIDLVTCDSDDVMEQIGVKNSEQYDNEFVIPKCLVQSEQPPELLQSRTNSENSQNLQESENLKNAAGVKNGDLIPVFSAETVFVKFAMLGAVFE